MHVQHAAAHLGGFGIRADEMLIEDIGVVDTGADRDALLVDLLGRSMLAHFVQQLGILRAIK